MVNDVGVEPHALIAVHVTVIIFDPVEVPETVVVMIDVPCPVNAVMPVGTAQLNEVAPVEVAE